MRVVCAERALRPMFPQVLRTAGQEADPVLELKIDGTGFYLEVT